MRRRRSRRKPSAPVSEGASLGLLFLGLVVVGTPLVAGGWPLLFLPVWISLIGVGWLACSMTQLRTFAWVSLPGLSCGLLLLAALTLGQTLPILASFPWLSPEAAEVSRFLERPHSAVSYEVGASLREAAKLLAYAMLVALAQQVARRSGVRPVLWAVVAAGVASTLVAFGHWALGITTLWGVFEGLGDFGVGATFLNANHASAFLALCALSAAGLAGATAERSKRWLLVGVSIGLSAASFVAPSKGGILTLLVGFALFAVAALRLEKGRRAMSARFAVLVAVPWFGLLWQLDATATEFGWNSGYLGLGEKLAAMKSAWPMILDHPWTGVGRGAYISIYPRYQESPLQLIFAFPENLAVQLVSEWGLVVGTVTLLSLVGLVLRRLVRVNRVHELGALLGVFVVLVHDLADFSLEMPGVAVLVAAILGASDAQRSGAVSVPAWLVSLLVFPVLALSTALALRSGDVRSELAWLNRHAQDVANGTAVDQNRIDRALRRHPANGLVATQVAYLLELATPSDYAGRLRAVNRALYLFPQYADAHLLAARVLEDTGHRNQAMEELRTAWTLSSGRQDVLLRVAASGRNPEELLRAVPRRDVVLDTPNLERAESLLRLLMAGREKGRALALVEALQPPGQYDSEDLGALGRMALSVGKLDWAEAALERGLRLAKEDPMLHLSLARLKRKRGAPEEARRILEQVKPTEAHNKAILQLRLDLEIDLHHLESAHRTVDELEKLAERRHEKKTPIEVQRARLHLLEKRPDRAITVLTESLRWEPSHLSARMMRASALEQLGRYGEARLDAEIILRREPGHRGAQALIERLAPK